MAKTAKTSQKINPLLANRWSPRAFSDQPVSDDIIIKLFEAARWAPSSMNEQPWVFFAGKKQDETYQKIFNTLVEFNQLWASTAPLLILSCGNTMGKDNRPNKAYQYDVGQAVAHLTFQAMSEGIFVHQMGGFSQEKAKELFLLPPNFEPLTVIAAGYLGDPGILNPRMQVSEKAERERKPLDNFVFHCKFGNVFPLINKMKS